jgi:hypothetical protein
MDTENLLKLLNAHNPQKEEIGSKVFPDLPSKKIAFPSGHNLSANSQILNAVPFVCPCLTADPENTNKDRCSLLLGLKKI